MTKKTERVGVYELGESFPCACGEQHKLEGVYLAAHWSESLTHTCDKCGTTHELLAGCVTRRLTTVPKMLRAEKV